MEGYGIYIWADGWTYEGEWKQNKMAGHGTYTWPDGIKYIGQYKNDLK